MSANISWPAIIGIIHPNVGGWLGGFITRKNINPWYEWPEITAQYWESISEHTKYLCISRGVLSLLENAFGYDRTSLKKPTWTPPKWAFGPIWTSLYCFMGYASYLVYRDSDGFDTAILPLSIYGVNLALNWAWTPIFFGAHNIKLALLEIILLWGSTVILSISFYRVNRLAGCLILPYLAWNTLATALNYVIFRDNSTPVQRAIDEKQK